MHSRAYAFLNLSLSGNEKCICRPQEVSNPSQDLWQTYLMPSMYEILIKRHLMLVDPIAHVNDIGLLKLFFYFKPNKRTLIQRNGKRKFSVKARPTGELGMKIEDKHPGRYLATNHTG